MPIKIKVRRWVIEDMLLEECLNHKVIVKEYSELDLVYKGNKYTIKVGDTFGRLEVVKLVGYKEKSIRRKGCICKCNCSDNSYIGPLRLYMLISGDLISCGCYSREIHSEIMIKRNTKHGYSVRKNREKLYILWGAMIDRANNHNRWDAKYYADKGITVCDDWRDYTKFREWALSNGYEEGLSLDREDNSLGYEPSNCRWIPLKLQSDNRTNSRILVYGDESHSITEWSRITGISWTTIDNRLKSGKTVGQALGYEA